MIHHWTIHRLSTFSTEETRRKDGTVSGNFVENTLTQSEAIETYTPYDVTSSRPRKTKIALFANFGGIEKLFCAPEQSLNSKIMNQCNIDFKVFKQLDKQARDTRANVVIVLEEIYCSFKTLSSSSSQTLREQRSGRHFGRL